MKYIVYFKKEAHLNIIEGVAWYEERREGLGDELLIAIENEKHFT